MFHSISRKTKQTILNHFLDEIFRLLIKQYNFVDDVSDLVYLHLKM